jgi:hypothetical protein
MFIVAGGVFHHGDTGNTEEGKTGVEHEGHKGHKGSAVAQESFDPPCYTNSAALRTFVPFVSFVFNLAFLCVLRVSVVKWISSCLSTEFTGMGAQLCGIYCGLRQ